MSPKSNTNNIERKINKVKTQNKNNPSINIAQNIQNKIQIISQKS